MILPIHWIHFVNREKFLVQTRATRCTDTNNSLCKHWEAL